MPVFDFNDAPVSKEKCVCTYTTFQSNEPDTTPEKSRSWCWITTRSSGLTILLECLPIPSNGVPLSFQGEDGVVPADILKMDARFVPVKMAR